MTSKYPFMYEGRSIIVTPEIYGLNGIAYHPAMLLDTGAEYTVFDIEFAVQIGIDLSTVKNVMSYTSSNASDKALQSHLKSFSLFGRKEKNFPIYFAQFASGMKFVEGLVGVDFLLRLHRMKIDFDKEIIEV